MVQTVYGDPKLTLKQKIEHLCFHGCRLAPIDPDTGHVVGFWCKKLTIDSGLRICDICDREYIDKTKNQNPDYETNCPECVKRYGL
jgi:hypothetical protein